MNKDKKKEKKQQQKKKGGKNQQKKAKNVNRKNKRDALPQEYLDKVKNLKLTRIPRKEVPLPVEGKRNVLITSALPYVNNVPHLGNLIGCVLSADVFARYSRLRGYNSLYICGTDENGTATQVKAIKEKKEPIEVCDYYHKIHAQIYENFEIEFDNFGRTSKPHHDTIVQDIFNQVNAKGFFEEKTIQQYYDEKAKMALADRFVLGTCPHCGYEGAKGDQCDQCGKLLEPTDLINPKSFISGETPVLRDSRHLFLNLETLAPQIQNFIETASVKGKWTQNSISISNSWVREGLQSRCMTRDLSWGVDVPVKGFEDKCFYVWFDAPIGYISITAEITKEWKQWWCNPENVDLYQFMGKDNVPFHTVLFPATLLGTGDDWTLIHHISTTEYINYETGKFSKSNSRGVFGNHVAEMPFPISNWRYYLLANRPEQSDSVFNWDDFQSRVNQELLPKPGNLVQRVLKFVFVKLDGKVPVAKSDELTQTDLDFLAQVKSKIDHYCESMEVTKMREALKTVMEICADCNKFMQDRAIWAKETDETTKRVVLAIMCNCIRIAACLFEPFMPSFSAKIYFFLGLERTEADEVMIETLLNTDPKEYVTLIPEGLKMNQPVPIFERVGDISEFRERFK